MQAFSSLVNQTINPNFALQFFDKKDGVQIRKTGFRENERKKRLEIKKPPKKDGVKRFTKTHMKNLRAIEKGVSEGKSYVTISIEMGKARDWASNFMGIRRKKLQQGYKSPR